MFKGNYEFEQFLKMMKFLLKKKIYLYSTGDYVTYLSKNKNVDFQMDIFRNNITDLQIIYNKVEYRLNKS